jgi:hypothetical protein
MMAQAVAGLAAKAVNGGRGDELVWVESGNRDVEDWFARLSDALSCCRTGAIRQVWKSSASLAIRIERPQVPFLHQFGRNLIQEARWPLHHVSAAAVAAANERIT